MQMLPWPGDMGDQPEKVLQVIEICERVFAEVSHKKEKRETDALKSKTGVN